MNSASYGHVATTCNAHLEPQPKVRSIGYAKDTGIFFAHLTPALRDLLKEKEMKCCMRTKFLSLSLLMMGMASAPAHAGVFDDIAKNTREQVAGLSDELLIQQLNHPNWMWLVFQYNRVVTVEEAQKRVESSSTDGDKFARLICEETAKNGVRNAVVSELFSAASKRVSQVSYEGFKTCSGAETKYQLPQKELQDYLARAKPTKEWSTAAILRWLELNPKLVEVEATRFIQLFEQANSDAILRFSRILLGHTSDHSVQARKQLLSSSLKRESIRAAIVEHSVEQVRGRNPKAVHLLTDLDVVIRFADRNTLLALADIINRVIDELKRKGIKEAQDLTRAFTKSIYGGSGGGGRSGSLSGGEAALGGSVADGYGSGDLDSDSARLFLRDITERQNLVEFANQVGAAILEICRSAQVKRDQEVISTCANEVIEKLLRSNPESFAGVIATLVKGFGHISKKESFAQACGSVSYREQALQMQAAAAALNGQNLEFKRNPEVERIIPQHVVGLKVCNAGELELAARSDRSETGYIWHSENAASFCMNYFDPMSSKTYGRLTVAPPPSPAPSGPSESLTNTIPNSYIVLHYGDYPIHVRNWTSYMSNLGGLIQNGFYADQLKLVPRAQLDSILTRFQRPVLRSSSKVLSLSPAEAERLCPNEKQGPGTATYLMLSADPTKKDLLRLELKPAFCLDCRY